MSLLVMTSGAWVVLAALWWMPVVWILLRWKPDMGGFMSICAPTFIFCIWSLAAQQYRRSLLTVHELRVPGVGRVFVWAVFACALGTLAMMCAPLLMWPDATVLSPQLVLLAICMGCLQQLVGPWLREVLLPALTVVTVAVLFHLPYFIPRERLTILAAAMLMALAWRVAALRRALLRGVRPTYAADDPGAAPGTGAKGDSGSVRTAGSGSRGTRSAAAVLRTALGPVYERAMPRPAGLPACFFMLVAVVGNPRSGPAWLLLCIPMVANAWLQPRLVRLAGLLSEPGVEIAELVLLPGAGGPQDQSGALLSAALVRPLAWYALAMAGFIAGYAAVLGRIHAPSVALLPAALLAGGLVLVAAAEILGVLARKIQPGNLLAQGAMSAILYPPCLVAVHDFGVHSGRVSAVQGIAWLLALGAVSACLIGWGWVAGCRPRLLHP